MEVLQRKIVAFFFILIVAMPVFLSFKFVLEQCLIEQEVEEKMNSVVLQTIKVAKKDIVWVKNGKEILLGDRYFDIKSYQIHNDVITLTGFFDAEETTLSTQIKKYNENNNSSNNINNVICKLLFPVVFNNILLFDYNKVHRLMRNLYFSYTEMLPLAPSLSIMQPPKLSSPNI